MVALRCRTSRGAGEWITNRKLRDDLVDHRGRKFDAATMDAAYLEVYRNLMSRPEASGGFARFVIKRFPKSPRAPSARAAHHPFFVP